MNRFQSIIAISTSFSAKENFNIIFQAPNKSLNYNFWWLVLYAIAGCWCYMYCLVLGAICNLCSLGLLEEQTMENRRSKLSKLFLDMKQLRRLPFFVVSVSWPTEDVVFWKSKYESEQNLYLRPNLKTDDLTPNGTIPVLTLSWYIFRLLNQDVLSGP